MKNPDCRASHADGAVCKMQEQNYLGERFVQVRRCESDLWCSTKRTDETFGNQVIAGREQGIDSLLVGKIEKHHFVNLEWTQEGELCLLCQQTRAWWDSPANASDLTLTFNTSNCAGADMESVSLLTSTVSVMWQTKSILIKLERCFLGASSEIRLNDKKTNKNELQIISFSPGVKI